MEWMSVNDQMPTDGDSTLVVCEYGVTIADYNLDKDDGPEWFVADPDDYFDYVEAYKVTHWMPLPPAPVTLKQC